MDPSRIQLAMSAPPTSSALKTVSPPTRGWTCRASPKDDHPTGGFPRPRGDGPSSGAHGFPAHAGMEPAVAARGFPAHAGMDPSSDDTAYGPGIAWLRACRFPRPRGDGPPRRSDRRRRCAVSPPTRGWTPPHATARALSQVSPPTRGWTRDRRAPRRSDFRGFPAHAGMDPVGVPVTNGTVDLPGTVSPPTRGWTRM